MAQSSFIIRLGVKDVDTVKRALEGMGKDGEQALNKIKSASAQGTSGLRRFNATTALTTRAVASLSAAFAGFVAAFSVRALVDYSDQWTQINNKLLLVTKSSKELTSVQKQLFDVAQDSRASFGDLATLYQRVGLASKSLGATQQEQIQFTEGVAKALAVTGTSSTTAQGALLQLGQAIGSGTVRAEEFNSVLEGAPRILQAVADGLKEAGGDVATLKNLVIAGKVSSEAFFRAFLTQLPVLRQETDATSTTIDQAFTVLGNAMLKAVGQFNDASNASTKFANALKGVASGIESVSDPLSRGIKLLREWTSAATTALHDLPATIYRATGGTAFVTGSGFAGSPEQGGRRAGQRALTGGGVSIAGGGEKFDPAKISASLAKAQTEADAFLKKITESNLQATGQLITIVERRRDEELKTLETLAASEKEKADARVKINETAEAEIANIKKSAAERTKKEAPGLDVAAVRSAIDDAKKEQADARQSALDDLQSIRDANLEATGKIVELIKIRRDREIAALDEIALTEQEKAEARVLINQTAAEQIIDAHRKTAEEQNKALEESQRTLDRFGQTASRVFADMVVDGEFTADSIIKSFQRIAVDNAFQQIFAALTGQAGGFLSNIFGSASTGAFAGGSGPAAGSFRAAQTLHSGGVVGGAGGSWRTVPAHLFDGAARFHSGGYVGSGEVPAILQRGETVLPRGARGINVVVNNNNGSNVKVGQSDSGLVIDIDAMVANALARNGSKSQRIVGDIARQGQRTR